jgi:hypothetical protein
MLLYNWNDMSSRFQLLKCYQLFLELLCVIEEQEV